MSWITITADDIDDTKLAPLVAVLRSAALAEGQGDPVPELLATVVQRVRLEIAAGGHVVSADAAKVPPSLKRLVARWAVWDAKGRLEQEPSEQEKTDHRDDLAFLRRIAAGDLGVEMPDDPVTPQVTGGPGMEVVESRGREATRAKLSGLL